MIYKIGMDPGFGEAGAVLRGATRYAKAWATWAAGTGDEFLRAMAMAQAMVNWVVAMTQEHDMADDELVVCIEMHVYKQNPRVYRMQSRLLEEIEAGLYAMVTPLVGVLTLAEHMPSTAKQLATGSGKATKAEMQHVAKRYFGNQTWKKVLREGTKDTGHTLADAWAHSLVADELDRAQIVRNLTKIQAHEIQAHEIRALAEGNSK